MHTPSLYLSYIVRSTAQRVYRAGYFGSVCARRRDWDAVPHVAATNVVTQATGIETIADESLSSYQTEQCTSPTAPSLASSSTKSESEEGHFPIPQVQGVVPGRRRLLPLSTSPSPLRLHSHSLLHSQTTHDSVPISQTIKTSQTLSLLPSLTESSTSSTIHSPSSPLFTSRYPRISPPGFLYPSTIVPQRLSDSPSLSQPTVPANNFLQTPASIGDRFETPAMMTTTLTTSQPSMMNQANYRLAYLPEGYKILLIGTLAMLALMVMCACLIFCINFPLKTWRVFGGDGDDGNVKKSGRKKEHVKNDKRPFDKPSKYASRHGSGDGYEKTGEGGIEMQHHRYPHRWAGEEGLYTSQPRASFPGGIERRLSSPSPRPSSSTTSSPQNPFLDVPAPPPRPAGHAEPWELGSSKRVKRSEVEYKTEYAAFFSHHPDFQSHPSSSSSPSSPANPASPTPTCTLNVSSTHDLESGIAPTPARAVSIHHRGSSREAREHGGDIARVRSIVKKSVDWFDQGFEYMDGAVDGFVARVARWTDDYDDDEKASLLPMARGGVDMEMY